MRKKYYNPNNYGVDVVAVLFGTLIMSLGMLGMLILMGGI